MYPSYPQQQGHTNYGINLESDPANSANASKTSIREKKIDDKPFLSDTFNDINIRYAFIRKVYSILSIQMLFTTLIVSVFLFVRPVKEFFFHYPWILFILLIPAIVLAIVLACCHSVTRKFPLNIILLMVFTLLMSCVVGAICSTYSVLTVLMAVCIVCVIVIALTLFAFQTKIDFTGFGVYLFVFGIVLVIFGLLCIIIQSQILQIVYASLGSALYCFYIVFDTQLMLGGKHKHSFSPEDYIIAALNLYMDIINLFLFILELVGSGRR